MNSKIISKIRTVSEADQLTEELEILKKSLFESGERSFDSTLASQIRNWSAEIIRDEIQDNDKARYLDELMQMIKKMEVFKLVLAFEPSDSGINKFSQFINDNVGSNVILDIEFDPEILAGAKISYKGKYHDFSMKKIFDEEFEEKKEEFEKIILKQNY